jgi:hypothetical protein
MLLGTSLKQKELLRLVGAYEVSKFPMSFDAEGFVASPEPGDYTDAPMSMLADESKHDKNLKLNRPTHTRHPSDLDGLLMDVIPVQEKL